MIRKRIPNRYIQSDYFKRVIELIRLHFKNNLLAVFIHGSLFDGTFDRYSDYDIVVILKTLPEDILERDGYAQDLKFALSHNWDDNPCSFDFYTIKEFEQSAKTGHPFVKSILLKGDFIFDPNKIFKTCLRHLNKNISLSACRQMANNLLFLADRNIEVAKYLLRNHKIQFALSHASSAITFLTRSYLIKKGHNIYQGEIYQFFYNSYNNKLSSDLKTKFWRYVFKANQINARLKEPHVDVPLQDSQLFYQQIDDKEYIIHLIEIYTDLKKQLY